MSEEKSAVFLQYFKVIGHKSYRIRRNNAK